MSLIDKEGKTALYLSLPISLISVKVSFNFRPLSISVMVGLLLIATLCIVLCGLSTNKMVKLWTLLCRETFFFLLQTSQTYKISLSVLLRICMRDFLVEVIQITEALIHSSAEQKKNCYVLERWRRQTSPRPPSPLAIFQALCGLTSDSFWGLESITNYSSTYCTSHLHHTTLISPRLWSIGKSEKMHIKPPSAAARIWTTESFCSLMLNCFMPVMGPKDTKTMALKKKNYEWDCQCELVDTEVKVW